MTADQRIAALERRVAALEKYIAAFRRHVIKTVRTAEDAEAYDRAGTELEQAAA